MTHAMIDTIQEAITGAIENPLNEQSLTEENAFLRSMMVDLLIKNQKLRCAAQSYAYQAAGY
jgi:hypothetical protein